MTEPIDPAAEALADLKFALNELKHALPEYERAEAFAKGKIEEFQSINHRIRDILEKSADSYVFKLAGVPLRVMSDRMKLTGITVDKGAQDTWQSIWDANNLNVWAKETHRRAFKFGDAYMRAWPDEAADNTGAEDGDVTAAGVTLSYLDPRFTRVVYDPQDERKPLYAVMTWTEKSLDWAMLEYRDRILMFSKKRGSTLNAEQFTNDPDAIARQQSSGITQISHWTPSDYVKQERQADGTVLDVVIPAEQPNEWQEITIKHFRTSMPYGVPEHSGAYGPASAIAKLLVTQLATVDTQGWKTRYGLVDTAAMLDNAGEQVDWEDDADSPTVDEIKARNRAPRRARPGEMEVFDNIKEVGEWSAADPKVFTDPVQLYMTIMSTVTATPFYSFDPGGEQPSGKSREIADEPLNAKMEDREAMFDGPWKELGILSLRMIGKSTKECSPKWKPHTLATTVDDWTAVKAEQDAGVPIRDSLIRAGIAAEDVDQWLEDKNDLSVSTASVELLGALGDALQRLGHTPQAPLVSQEQLQGIISQLIGQFGIAPPDASLTAEVAEADAKAAQLDAQVAAGTHDVAGNPLQPPDVVGTSTKQAAADNGAPKGAGK